nr:MAG: nonstructural protein [Microvirus sp.]
MIQKLIVTSRPSTAKHKGTRNVCSLKAPIILTTLSSSILPTSLCFKSASTMIPTALSSLLKPNSISVLLPNSKEHKHENSIRHVSHFFRNS